MPRQRKFLKQSEKAQIECLLHCLKSAMKEHPEISMSKYAANHHTDLIGIACQYGRLFGVRRSDFDKIKELSIGQIIDMFNVGYKKQ